MASMWKGGRRWVVALVCAALAAVGPAGRAAADQDVPAPTLPVFVPYASDWTPDYTVYPYNMWSMRVTDEQLTAQRESCQWFNAQYDTLMSQVFGFQHFLGDQHDNWSSTGVQPVADRVSANLDQSAAFLDPRAHTLYIVNYPDQSEYSPLYNGDSFYHLWYQFTHISDKIKTRQPSGIINANIATANVYGNVIRDSGVCNGA